MKNRKKQKNIEKHIKKKNKTKFTNLHAYAFTIYTRSLFVLIIIIGLAMLKPPKIKKNNDI